MNNNIKIVKMSTDMLISVGPELINNLRSIFENDVVDVKNIEEEKTLKVKIKCTDKNIVTMFKIYGIYKTANFKDFNLSYHNEILDDVSIDNMIMDVKNDNIDLMLSYNKLKEYDIVKYPKIVMVDSVLSNKLKRLLGHISCIRTKRDDSDLDNPNGYKIYYVKLYIPYNKENMEDITEIYKYWCGYIYAGGYPDLSMPYCVDNHSMGILYDNKYYGNMMPRAVHLVDSISVEFISTVAEKIAPEIDKNPDLLVTRRGQYYYG